METAFNKCEGLGLVCFHEANECETCSVKYPNIRKNRRCYLKFWECVMREGVSEFLEWLNGTDFFTAPCSTKYHLSRSGGLCEHSLNVLDVLLYHVRRLSLPVEMETIVILALGHDVCKADFYGVQMRNVKENGKWVQKPFYTVEEKFPMGHGEKSVAILQRFFKLTEEEQLAIRWHMGGFTAGMGDFSIGSAFNNACKISKLVPLLHMADFEATNLIEKE